MSKKCYNLNYLEIYQNKPFVYERKSLDNETIYSYKTVIQETKKCLEYFQKYQVKNNCGIAIDIKEHSAINCILLLGVLNHKCHFYCLDFEETNDVHTYLSLSGVQYVISPKLLSLKDVFEKSVNEIKILEEIYYLYSINSENKTFQNVRLCYTIATSGSTGQPKMVHVPYECIEPNIKALSSLLSIDENDIIFMGSPASFDPFIVELFSVLENGAGILLTSKEIRLQPQKLLQLLFPNETKSTKGVSIYQTTPSLFRIFGQQNIRDVILTNKSSLRCLILGGEAFPSRLELKTWLPLDFPTYNKRIFNIYGITEVSCWFSIYEFNKKNLLVEKDFLPLGKPLDDFTFFRIVDEFENVLNHNDCIGELEIGSSIRRCFIPQYDSDIKILKLNDIIYRKTGDFVKRDSAGDIYYIGRTNNTIKRLGKRLNLDSLNKKVENLLNSENEFYKILFLWHNESTKLVLYIVNEKNVNIDDRPLIIKLLKENLEKYEQPDKIFYGNELPLNRHGKIDGKKILEMLLTKQKSYNSPVKIFKDFLRNIMGLQVDDNEVEPNKSSKRLKFSTDISFTQAGGTSFQALSLATEMAELIDDNEQRKILEMLLDNKVTIAEILQFLMLATRKLDNNSCEHVYLVNTNPNYGFKLLWRCDLKKCIDATPTLYEEKFVAVGSHSHLLLTVNAITGEEISCLKLNDRIECSVVFVSSQLALVGCYDGFLYGFDFNTGNIIWRLNAKGMIKAKPLVVKDFIIIASYAEDYNIVAFDIKSLTLKWRLKLGSKGIFSSPIQISDDSILSCTLDGTYALIEAATGIIKWLQKLDSPIFSTAATIQISNKTYLVLAEVNGLISLCNAENGEKISSFQTEGNVFSGLTLHHFEDMNHTLIIFGCHDKNIYCLNLEYSSKYLTLSWKYPLNSAVYSTPILISQRYILVCSTKGLLVLLDMFKVNVLASYDIKAEVFSTATCLNDKFIYVGSRDNHLYGFEIEK